MTSPSVVRIAKPGDEAEIWRLFLENHKENGLFSFDAQKVRHHLGRALHPELIHPTDTNPRGVCAVIGEVGGLEALCCVTVGSCWYSSEFCIEELIVYVDALHRKSRHAKALIQWMRLQSDLSGRKLIASVISNERTEAKVDLFSRLLPQSRGLFHACTHQL